MRSILILLLSFFLFTGCAGTGYQLKQAAKIQHELVVNRTTITKNQKAYIDGVVRSLRQNPIQFHTKQTDLALRLSEDVQKSVGLPDPNYVLDINSLLSDNEKIKQLAEADLAKKEAELAKSLTDKQLLETQLAETNEKLAKIAETKYNAEKRNWFSTIWHWGLGVFGIGGLIALCVFFPVIIPFVMGILRGLVSGVSSIISAIFKRK